MLARVLKRGLSSPSGWVGVGSASRSSERLAGRWYDVWRISASGHRQRAPISHAQLLQRASLFPRDMLTFDVSSDSIKESSTTGARPPRILVRESAIMLTAGHLRCVIRKEEVFLFDADRPMVADFARRLELKLARSHAVEAAAMQRAAHWKCGGGMGADDGAGAALAAAAAGGQPGRERASARSATRPPLGPPAVPTDADDAPGDDDGPPPLYPLLGADASPATAHLNVPPFEMRALDLVLEEVTACYARRAALLSPMVDSLLSGMTVAGASPDGSAGVGLSDVSVLLPLRDSLTGFELETAELIRVIVGLLDSDEDMCDMLLTERALLRGARPPVSHHEPVELLLEEYARQMASVLTEAQALKKRVASASELAQLHLDIFRNRMVSTNVHLSMVSTALASVTTTAGLFGMNLRSGLEESEVAFQIVSAGSFCAAALVLAACWSYLHGNDGFKSMTGRSSRGTMINDQLRSSAAVRRVFRNLDSLQFVLANKLPAAPAADDGPPPFAFGSAAAAAAMASTPSVGDEASSSTGGLSVGALKRELEHASGSPVTAEELALIVRLLERDAGEGLPGAKLSKSHIAALWRRFALPRDFWSYSEPAGTGTGNGTAGSGDGPAGR